MAKNPAFLFYSNDFYEGTRMMLPNERACFIDLIIYQHQHGLIPNNLDRVLLYCSGIDKATLEATLEAKFVASDEGYFNEKLKQVIEQREEYSNKQSENGLIGQFFKKAKSTLNTKEYSKLYSYIQSNSLREFIINDLKNNESNYQATLKGMLEASLKHLENEIENEIENKDLNKNYLNTSNSEKLILFDSWWNLYKKKRGRDKAIDKWLKLSIEEINKCLEVVTDYEKSNPDKQYQKDPSTYLNGKHWNDEIIIKTLNNGITNNQQQKRTLEQQAEDITARILGNGTGQNQNTTDPDNGIEDIDFVFS